MEKTKIKLFEHIVKDICSKTKTSIPIIKSYKLRHYTAWCSYKEELGKYRISYNSERFNEYSNKSIVMIAVHEVGHIRTFASNREDCEYKAELFALKNVKKYYPKYFSLKFTKDTIKQNKKWYTKAFKRTLKTWKTLK